MKIGIIGAGNVGRAISSSAVRAGHDVLIWAPRQEQTAEVAAATGARPVGSGEEAATQAELLILAVPTDARADVLTALGEVVHDKVVVDVSNRPTPDPESEAGTSAAEELQAQFPIVTVIKAFNTLLVARQADPVVAGVRMDGFIAGDDERGKAMVLELLGSMGFRPIDAGGLIYARTLEGMGWLNIARNMQGGTWQEGWKLLGPDSE